MPVPSKGYTGDYPLCVLLVTFRTNEKSPQRSVRRTHQNHRRFSGEYEKGDSGPSPPSHLTIPPPGDIVFPLNATTEKNPRSGSQRGVRLVKAPCDGGGRYHSGAARDDRDGFLPLQRYERPDGMMSRFACSQSRPHKLRITRTNEIGACSLRCSSSPNRNGRFRFGKGAAME